MPPKDGIEIGPHNWKQLQEINNKYFSRFGDLRDWASYGYYKEQGYNDEEISRIYRNTLFKQQFGNDKNYEELKKLHPIDRDEQYLKAKLSEKDYQSRTRDIYWAYNPEEAIKAFIPGYNKLTIAGQYNDALDTKAVENAQEYTPIENSNQAKKLADKLMKEAKQKYPDAVSTISQMASVSPSAKILPGMGSLLKEMSDNELVQAAGDIMLNASTSQTGVNSALNKLREQYVLDRLKIPQNENTYKDLTEQQFVALLPKLSNAYRKYHGTKYLPDDDIKIDDLYKEVKPMLDAGLVYRAESAINKYFDNIVGKYQPNWKSDDPRIRSRADIWWSNVKGSTVETLQNTVATPVSLVKGIGSAIEGENFWKGYSELPNLIHNSVQRNIIGDEAIAYGDSWGSATANSGYSMGAMAAESLLAFLTAGVGKGFSLVGRGLEAGSTMSKAFNAVPRVLTTTNSLMAGVREGTVDAVEKMNAIIEYGRNVAATLPLDAQKEYLEQVKHEAYTAFGRTMLEEAMIVDAGTILGLGYLGALGPFKNAGTALSTSWQRGLVPKNFWGKLGVGTGHYLEGAIKRTAGETLEELGQGMVSGIAEQRAKENLFKYETALRYGLGADYASNFHVGFLQGIADYSPQAWVEMDPENLVKQTVLSTLLFGGVHIPGMGKTRAQINAENKTKIGKVWDYIRKYSPVNTGIGDILSDVKEGMFAEPNRIESGLASFINNPEIQDILQTQAALTDIGIQMAQAIEDNDITEYQKASAAYYAGQAVMLANAQQKNPTYGQKYIEVLQNRANFDSLSEEDKATVLDDFHKTTQVGFIATLSPEEQIKVMKQVAQRSLDLMDKANNIFKKYQDVGMHTLGDIRPLVFDELLNSLAPEVIEENWKQLQPAIAEITNASSDKSIPGDYEDATKNTVMRFMLNNYFRETDFSKRSAALNALFKDMSIEGVDVDKEDVTELWTTILNALAAEMPTATDIVNSDVKLMGWRNAVYEQWNSMFKRVQAGEGSLSRAQMKELSKRDSIYNQLGLNAKERRHATRLQLRRNDVRSLTLALENAKEDLGDDFESFFTRLDRNAERTNLQEAKKILDTADEIKQVATKLAMEIPNGAEFIPSIEALIHRAKSMVVNAKSLLDINTYSETHNPTLLGIMSEALDTVANIGNITVPAPEVVGDPADTSSLDSTDDNVSDVGGIPPEPTTPEGTAPSPKVAEPQPNIQDTARECQSKLSQFEDSSTKVIGDFTDETVSKEEALNSLKHNLDELVKLHKLAPGDQLKYEIWQEIARTQELIDAVNLADVKPLGAHGEQLSLEFPAAPEVEPKPKAKPRKVDPIYSVRRDIKNWAKTNNTLESLVDTFWNEDYKHFDTIKSIFKTKDNFLRYFENGQYNLTIQNGEVVFEDSEGIWLASNRIDTEEVVERRGLESGELMSRAQWEREMTNEFIDNYRGSELEYTLAALAEIRATVKNGERIWDAEGHVTDGNKRYVSPKSKDRPKTSKKLVTIDEITERLTKVTGLEQDRARSIIVDLLQMRTLPTRKELLDKEYDSYKDAWVSDQLYYGNGPVIANLEEGLTQFENTLAEYYSFQSPKDTRGVNLTFYNGRGERRELTYTTSNDYPIGTQVQVRTPFGVKKMTVSSYTDMSDNLLSLEKLMVMTPQQAREKLDDAVSVPRTPSKKQHQTALENSVRESRKDKLGGAYREVYDTLESSGAFTYINEGNLKEGDELGFVLGSWESPEGPRPVVYIVTKKTFDGASNGNELFSKHQVIGVFDTDKVTEDSTLNAINVARKDLTTGTYFELEQPVKVTSVSDSSVQHHTISGQSITMNTVDETNLNKVLETNSEGKFGTYQNGEFVEAKIIVNNDGNIQVSDSSYDSSRLWDTSQSQEENSKRIYHASGDTSATLPNKMTCLIVPVGKHDSAQIVVYAVDSTIPGYIHSIRNSLETGKIGQRVRDMIEERVIYLWRLANNPDVKLRPAQLSLAPFFRMKNNGSVKLTYQNGTYVAEFVPRIGDTTPIEIARIPFGVSDPNGYTNSYEYSKATIEGMKDANGKSIADNVFDAIVAALTDENNPLIIAANKVVAKAQGEHSVSGYAETEGLLQDQIADGLLYAPNAALKDGKLHRAGSEFVAYIEGTGPVSKPNTKSATAPPAPATEGGALINTTSSTSQETPKRPTPSSAPESTTSDVKLNIRKKKGRAASRITTKRATAQPTTTSDSRVLTEEQLLNSDYATVTKQTTVSCSEEVWNSSSPLVRKQYLHCQ